MMIEKFQSLPDFPFEHYFDSANQYAGAIKYWMAVLRAAKGFDETKWMPRERPVEIDDDMYLGKVIDVTSKELRKEINLQTWSIPGDANMLFQENSGISQGEYKELKMQFGSDFTLDDHTLAGMTYQDALKEAQEEALQTPVKIWVENAVTWQQDPTHKDGGYEVTFERLLLTAQITASGEAAALHALGLFLEPGSAIGRVNEAFVDGMTGSAFMELR